jgi:hypothetical protein
MRSPSSVRIACRAFPTEQVTAELGFQLLDGVRERGLCDVALLSRARDIQVSRDR